MNLSAHVHTLLEVALLVPFAAISLALFILVLRLTWFQS